MRRYLRFAELKPQATSLWKFDQTNGYLVVDGDLKHLDDMVPTAVKDKTLVLALVGAQLCARQPTPLAMPLLHTVIFSHCTVQSLCTPESNLSQQRLFMAWVADTFDQTHACLVRLHKWPNGSGDWVLPLINPHARNTNSK